MCNKLNNLFKLNNAIYISILCISLLLVMLTCQSKNFTTTLLNSCISVLNGSGKPGQYMPLFIDAGLIEPVNFGPTQPVSLAYHHPDS